MHPTRQLTLLNILVAVAVLGCTAAPPAPVPRPSTSPPIDVRANVQAYIADVRSLMAEMDEVEAEDARLPTLDALKEHPVFQQTWEQLNAALNEAVTTKNLEVYRDVGLELEAEALVAGDLSRYHAVQRIRNAHAQHMRLLAQVAILSKKIDAMEPRMHELKNQLILAVADTPADTTFLAMVAILTNEQERFLAKLDAWKTPATQQR